MVLADSLVSEPGWPKNSGFGVPLYRLIVQWYSKLQEAELIAVNLKTRCRGDISLEDNPIVPTVLVMFQ
jgi:hypothetical protein